MDNRLDLNYNECIKVINNIGHSLYQNICAGTDVVLVPWGTTDWLAGVGFTLLMGVLGVMVVMLLVGMIQLMRDEF